MQDSILFWNAVALEANRVSHSDPDKRQQNGPTLSSRAIAIVHLAMYDAFAGIFGGGLPRYLAAPAAPAQPPDTARDAVAGAAHRTLSRLYSAQVDYFDAQLSCFNEGSASYRFGEQVGQALLDLRANDMDARDCGYMPSPKRGRHRRDPDNPGQGFNSPFYGAQTKTFAVKTRHKLKAPPFANGTDTKYLRALRDVRARGIKPDLTATLPTPQLFNRRRTPEETLVGIYWGYDGANRLGTPPRLYNQIVRQIAVAKANTAAENARLFALVNVAMADAAILAWEQKYEHDLWRPVVGIREHDPSMGPQGTADHDVSKDCDPGWLPLGAPATNELRINPADPAASKKNFTPPFPAYPSGHATFGAAAFGVTRLFYGVTAEGPDTLADGLEFVSDELDGVSRDNNGTVRPRHVRDFPGGLWTMIQENSISRVFLGVHWVFDGFAPRPNGSMDLTQNIGGVRLGLDIAADIFNGARNAGLVKSTV